MFRYLLDKDCLPYIFGTVLFMAVYIAVLATWFFPINVQGIVP